jgi:hypothetical protein
MSAGIECGVDRRPQCTTSKRQPIAVLAIALLFFHFAPLSAVGQADPGPLGAICTNEGGTTVPQSPVDPSPGRMDGFCCLVHCAAAAGNPPVDAGAIVRYAFARGDDGDNIRESSTRTPHALHIRPLGSRAPPAMSV